MLTNVKMPTKAVGILTFISMINTSSESLSLCFVLVFVRVFIVLNHLGEEERAGCFTCLPHVL